MKAPSSTSLPGGAATRFWPGAFWRCRSKESSVADPFELLGRLNSYLLLLLLAICSHPNSGFMNYFRPYVGALLVGSTLFKSPLLLDRLLRSRTLAYVAKISFALYVIHPFMTHTWLSSGDKLVRYAKRPLLFAATFLLAHISTFHFEQRWIDLGKASYAQAVCLRWPRRLLLELRRVLCRS